MQDDDAGRGSHLLSRISNEIVKAQKQYWGKGPVGAKSYMFDDMLFVVMHGGLTTAELSMLRFDQVDLVRHYRQTFENEMTERLTSIIEELTERKVIGYQAQVIFDPDRVIEMFIFDRPAGEDFRAATADGQTSDGRAGQATDRDALDPGDEPA